MSMKRNFFLVCCLAACSSLFAQEIPVAPYLPTQAKLVQNQKPPITVQFPYENMTMPRHAEHLFLLGQVHVEPPVSLEINGETVELNKNGAFVAYLPVTEGNFEFLLTAQSNEKTYQAVRHVRIPGTNLQDLQGENAIDTEELFPQKNIELRPGEEIPLFVRAMPGAQVTARLPGLKKGKKIALTEDSKEPGMYRATFTVDPKQRAKTTHVTYTLKDSRIRKKLHVTAPATITVLSTKLPYTFARVNKPGVKLRKLPTDSGNLYPDYRAYGLVRVTGERNDQYHLQLSDTETAWLEKTNFDLVTQESPEENILSFVRQTSNQARTQFVFKLNRPVPIKIHEYPDRLELVLYYVDGFEQNYSLDPTSPVVESVDWAEPTEGAVAFRLNFRKEAPLWGYGYTFVDNELVLELRHTPQHDTVQGQPLAGVRIVLDAGHSPRRQIPYDGAVGPTGYLEYEGTLALAEELKPMLEQAGATVLMTRWGDNQMSLQNRYDYARDRGAELFVSLHYNALPETANPRARSRGFSVYYTYPHSLKLAQSVHKAYAKHVPLADSGLFENTILFIPRMSEYPSILVESAYLILPEQEQLARTREGRAPFLKALYEGILKFYGATPADVKPVPEQRSKSRK